MRLLQGKRLIRLNKLLLLFMQVDRDIKVLIKLVPHQSRSASAWGATTNDTPPPASLSRVCNMGVCDVYRGIVMKVLELQEEEVYLLSLDALQTWL